MLKTNTIVQSRVIFQVSADVSLAISHIQNSEKISKALRLFKSYGRNTSTQIVLKLRQSTSWYNTPKKNPDKNFELRALIFKGTLPPNRKALKWHS